jgi:serine phosphatase RsbU (regulator of sigma subunit)
LNPHTGELYYINAGHETVYLTGPSGLEKSLLATGPAVGLFPDIEFEYKQIQIPPGNILFAFTDGLTEGISPAKELFGKERLLNLVSKPTATAAVLLGRITSHLFNHIGDAPLEDDVAMLAIQHQK